MLFNIADIYICNVSQSKFIRYKRNWTHLEKLLPVSRRDIDTNIY